MYEERKVRFNWKGFLLKLLIVLLILVLIFKLLPFGSRKEANGHTKAFNDNFNTIKDVGNNYYTKDKLPSDNDESKITLRQLINAKKIKTLKGSDKKVCNEDASYIKAYKKNIGYELEVHLVCGDEEETSYIYLGCFDKCVTKPTTKTTTTKKVATTKKSSNSKSNNSSSKATTKKVTTTTTTKVKKYAVIFNVNGGSNVNTQFVKEGEKAINPSVPTKNGYSFSGWFLNGEKYDFNTPVKENIILIAKWVPNDIVGINLNVTKTFNTNAYSALSVSKGASKISNIVKFKIPANLVNKSNVKIKDVTYIRNFTVESDLTRYYNYSVNSYLSEENKLSRDFVIDNLGTVDNIEITALNDNSVKWSGLVNSNCSSLNNNMCAYGIIYRVVWEYSE